MLIKADKMLNWLSLWLCAVTYYFSPLDRVLETDDRKHWTTSVRKRITT